MINPLQKLKNIIYLISPIKVYLFIYTRLHSIHEYVFYAYFMC